MISLFEDTRYPVCYSSLGHGVWMKRSVRIFVFVLFALFVHLQFAMPAVAQSWPTRQLTIVYPFAAGSSADILARLLASRLSELLGQPVIVENVAGTGGMLARF